MMGLRSTSRALRRAYTVALLLIAALSCASFVFLQASIGSMRTDSAVQRVSGNQVALLQKAVVLIETVVHAEQAAERRYHVDQLDEVSDELAAMHAALLDGNEALGLPGDSSEAVSAIYFSNPHAVDRMMRFFLSEVERLVEVGRDDPIDHVRARPAISIARTALESGLVAAVEQYQTEADEHVRRVSSIHLAVLVLMLVLLAIESRFIFLPAARLIEDNTREILQSRRELDHAATHDALTGLANRRLCRERLEAAIAEVDRIGGSATVIHVDLDDFKGVNDTFGHAAGDDVLWRVADRLRKAVREGDTVARIGGDEFLIVCPSGGELRDGLATAGKILAGLAKPVRLVNDVEVDVGCSIGTSRYPDDAGCADDLLIAADLALYRAKEAGRHQHFAYDRTMREAFESKVKRTRQVKHAIASGEMEVIYQPQIDMRTGAVVGVESLLRWRDADGALRAPEDFLDVADRSGGMVRLGAFIMDQAISTAGKWHREGLSFGRMAINVTAAQLRDANYIDTVLDRMFAHGLPPEKLAIEIIESVVISGHSRRLRVLLDELNDLNISVEFDDFGTGYASLTHLRDLPVNRIKIDKSFIQSVPDSPDHCSIVRGVIKIVGRLGIGVIAEGVETVEQARALSAWGCHFAQGFLYGRPAPLAETEAYLRLANYKRIEHAPVEQPETAEDDRKAVS